MNMKLFIIFILGILVVLAIFSSNNDNPPGNDTLNATVAEPNYEPVNNPVENNSSEDTTPEENIVQKPGVPI